MSPEAAEKLHAFFNTFTGDARPLLLLDFDGTLAPFRVDRFKARPYAGVTELLSRIQRQGRTRIGVVTGRPASEIVPMLGIKPELGVWGLHGAERLHANGHRELDPAPAAAEEKLEELRQQLHKNSLGGLFEDKPNACVMHWRGIGLAKAKTIEKRTRQLFEPLAEIEGLNLLEFEAGLELRVGRDKGGAVEAILSEIHNAGPVAYLGDDLTDEPAFRVVNGLRKRHLSVLMRRSIRNTDADVWLKPPDELRAFLAAWLRAVEAAHALHQVAHEEELAAV